MNHRIFFIILGLALLSSCVSIKVASPQPYGALPTDRQLAWHEMEMYNMIELNQNNALDIHGGWGNESPAKSGVGKMIDDNVETFFQTYDANNNEENENLSVTLSQIGC